MKDLLYDLTEKERERIRSTPPPSTWCNRKGETVAPPWWAYEMDKDIDHQLETGAEELDVQCSYCGRWCKSVSNFCSPECRRDYTELAKTEAERKKTRELLK